MQRDPNLLLKRAEYIQRVVNKKAAGVSTESVVKKLSKKLFISRATVWNDLYKQLK